MKFVKWLQTTFVASCVALGAMSMAQASNSELDPDYMRAIKAGAKEDYKTAVKHLNKAVKKDNPAAEFLLGQMYLNGLGVAKKPEKGARLIMVSCSRGYQHACKNIDKITAEACSEGDQEACSLPKLAK